MTIGEQAIRNGNSQFHFLGLKLWFPGHRSITAGATDHKDTVSIVSVVDPVARAELRRYIYTSIMAKYFVKFRIEIAEHQ
jgi:hypothetical protein